MVITADPSSKRVLPKPEVLRRNVVEKLERLDLEQLAVIHDWFSQLELEQAFKELTDGIAQDEAEGKLSPEAIEASIQEHRRRHPYGR